MNRESYLTKLREMQTELVALQEWVKRTEQRVIIVFEGRDAAGKGGMINTITQRVSPRVFRVVALPSPSDRERKQMYYQRYFQHFPAGGEVVIFDRSWYNRAGVEPVMGFCTLEQTQHFLDITPYFEHEIVRDGIYLLKYWLEVSNEKQRKRFETRIKDPAKHWKLSPMDLEARRRWYDYSRARDRMLAATDTEQCPWHIVPSDNKYKARLNCITHILDQLPYERIAPKPIVLPERDESHAYDDKATMANRRYVPDLFD